MTDLFDWMQSYWFELLSLTAQFAILYVVVWYARRSLRIQATSQRHAEPASRPAEAPAAFAPVMSAPVRPAPLAEPLPKYRDVERLISRAPAAPAPHAAPAAAMRVKRMNPWQAASAWLRTPWHQQPNHGAAVASHHPVERAAMPAAAPSYASVTPAAEEMPVPTYRGVGSMFSAPPEAEVYESEAVEPQHAERTGLLHGMVAWLRAPIGSSRSAA